MAALSFAAALLDRTPRRRQALKMISVGFVFLAALALGTLQMQRGRPLSGLLLISFGLLGLAAAGYKSH